MIEHFLCHQDISPICTEMLKVLETLLGEFPLFC